MVPLLADELMRCESLDNLFKRAIELIRAKFGVERCALFIVEGTNLRGTYGTAIDGSIVDEHSQIFPFDETWKNRFHSLKPQDSRWITVKETRRTWTGDAATPVGEGWIAVTPVYSGENLIGVLVNDDAITNKPLNSETQEVIAIFCSLLGSIIERKRAEDALRKANEELESRVTERTLELERSNEALQDEVFERTLAQEALATERTLLRTLIDNIPDYIFIKDSEGRFLISNTAHAQSVAISNPEDLNGKTAYDFYPRELAAHFDADDRRVIQSGQALVGAERVTLDAEGNRIWALTTKAPLRDQQGNVIGLVGISRDITERKQAEDALRKSEERYRILTDLISDYAFSTRVEPDGTLVTEWDTGDSFTRVTGFLPDEIHGTLKLYHPDDLDAVEQKLNEMRQGQSSSQECRIITKDGTVRWLLIHRRPVWDTEQNRVVHYYGVGQDITDRKLADEALANERRLLRTVIDAIPHLLWMKDIEGRFIFANQFWADRENTTPDVIIGKTDFDINSPELAEKYRADDQLVLESGRPVVDIDEMNYTQNGDQRWLLTTKVPVRDSQGHLIGVVGVARDVTEQKKAQQELANERSLLRTVIDAIPHLLWMKDIEGRFLVVNKYTLDDRELPTSDTMIGKTDFDIHPRELATKYHADDQKVIQSGVPLVDVEELNYTHKGEARWFVTTKVPLRDALGNITGLVGFARDITEHKKAQEELANERTLLRTIIDALPHFIWVKDNTGRFVLVNRFSHLDRQDTTLGKTDFDIHPPEAARKFYEDDLRVLQSGESLIDIEEQNLSPRGEDRWLLTTKVPLVDGHGKVTGLVGIARDITDRKQMENALRTSEQRYRSLVELAPDGIAVIADGRFMFVNQAAVELFGFTDAKNLPSNSVFEYFQSRDRDVLEAAILQVHHTGEPATCLDMQIVQMGREVVHCEMVIAPVVFNGHPAVQIIVRDVTERIQTELLRRESEGLRVALEKEQELGELKTKLMTTLSHELRTPLTIIQSSSEFLDRFHERLSAEQRQERLHNIQGQVQKLTTLAEDVSFLIREQIDQVTARFASTDLEQLCREIVGEMEFFGNSPRKLDFQVDGNLNNVLVDVRLIHRILSNLLSNAIKYSSESAEIALKLHRDANAILIQVIDNGIGIPEQDQERLFEIFHRGSNVGYISGTGIGLAIVKEAVTLHRGTISVESAESVGTTFTIRLPLLNGDSSSE